MVSAQEPGMWHITDDDGLPSRTVYHTAQDQKGYIWIGTEKGICRFDGKNFKTYKSNEFNDSEILKVEIDPLGRVWFRNLSGQLFYIEDEVIHNAQELFPDKLSNVADFSLDDHSIWIAFQHKTGKDYKYPLTQLPDRKYYLTCLSFDVKGFFAPLYIYDQTFRFFLGFRRSESSTYIFVRHSGSIVNNELLIRLDKTTTKLTTKNTLTYNKEITYRSYYLFEEELFLYFSKLPGNFFLKSLESQTKKKLTYKKKIFLNDFLFLDEKFWLITNEGIIIKDSLSDQSPYSTLLTNKSTNHLMIDNEGNKWISTTGNGIYIITAPQTQLIQTNNFPLPNNEVYSLAYDYTKEKLLVGHSKGQISVLSNNLDNQVITNNSSGRIIDFLIDQSGNYWCVNETELFLVNPNLTVKKHFWGGVKTILQSKDKNIWMGSYNFTHRVRHNKIDSINIEQKNRLLERIIFDRTYALYQDFADNIWIGTANGLHTYRDTAKQFLENGEHIPYNVSSITQSSDSVIWVATRGDGLLAIKNHKVIQRIKETDGLASNTVKKLFTTDHHLWVATDNGVNKIDLKSKKIEWINKTDGLPSNDINDIEVVNDKVWIATSKGLATFWVNAQHKNEVPPPIYISNIKIEEKDTTLQDSFLLSYDNNSIQINMIGLGYKGKGNISYQYKLSGLEEDWVSTTSQFARYPNLVPGNYTFEVFAVNEDQVKSSTPARVYFSIKSPWWKTRWFQIVCLVTIGGIVAYFVNARIQRKKEAQRFLDNVKELKTKALRSQMNPHFIFNALNAIQRFLTTNDREQAMNYLSSFGKLIRSVFEQSQLEFISLEEEIDFLKLYLDLEKLRFMDAISIQLDVSPDLQEISDEIHLPPLLIQPIIENSFKHGFLYKKEPGILSIKFSREDAFLICTVEDNGIGRKKAAALGQQTLKDRPSSGLKTSEERLKILKSSERTNATNIKNSQLNFIDLYDANGEVRGTLVEIKVYCSDLEPIEEL